MARPGSDRALVVEFDEGKIDAIFAELDQCQLPGAVVGISIGGKPVYRKGFGLANMELPVVLSPSIRMRIGSTTKHFAALAYMLLCEDGKAGIDDPVGKHLPELHPITHKATMRQLMGHISGLRDSMDVCLTFSGFGHRLSTDEVVSLYRDTDDVNAEPGTAWIYNNGGWQIVTVAIERITGKSLEHVLRERVFDPTGMYQSMLRRFDHDFVSNSATPHMMNRAGQYEKNESANYFATASAGEGGVVSTVDDMLLWLAHMDEIGGPAIWGLIKTPQRLANGTSTGYGLGLAVGRYRGVETLYHQGGGTGSNAQMLTVPKAGLDVVCMVNRQDVAADDFVSRILDACLPGLDVASNLESGPSPSGTFCSPTSGCVIHFKEDLGGAKHVISIRGRDFRFERGHDGVFRHVGVFAYGPQQITLVGDPANPTAIRFGDYGNVDELIAMPPPTNFDVGGIAGRFRASIGVEATVSDGDHGPQLHTIGRFGSVSYRLECLADGIWQTRHPTLAHRTDHLCFDCQGAGFLYSNPNTRSLPFRRVA